MPLTPGTRLGPYEVVGPLGAGGMGEVYRARDTKLNRDVALKILPDAFVTDGDRLARFKREAQLLASLNHSNIAQIYGFEDASATHAPLDQARGAMSDSRMALVMELVEGPTLAELIAQGPIALPDALPIARQIADALEAAHERGIVHRDLKPANIKIKGAWGPTPTRQPDGRLTPTRPASDIADGRVKVLDFGLAKATESGSDDQVSHATMTSPAMTAMGVILGTAGYMAPEQARGKAADKRVDIWAFGVVLYEMLTGRAAFPGDTITDVIASVVTHEPDWVALPADTPPSIRRLLRRCLEKNPSGRLRDAADARLEIEEAQLWSGDGGGDARPATDGSASRRRWSWLLLAPGALGVGVAIGALALGTRGGRETPLHVLNLTVPEASATTAALSPDGRWIAVIFDRKIFLKGMTEPAWRELANTSGTVQPLIWSPDSRSIAFPVDSSIRRVDLVGSRPQTICDRCVQPNSLRGGSWSRDGVLLIGGSPEDEKLGSGLLEISDSGGALKRVTTLDPARGENSHRFPTFLPDSRRFVFTVRRDNGEHEIRVSDLAGTPPRTIASGFSKTAYADGYLLFVRDEALLALPLDPDTVQATGDPVKVANSVSHNVGTALAAFTAGGEGTLVYGQAAATRGFAFFDRHGRKLADVTTRASDGGGRVSPDGRRAVIAEIDPDKSSTDIYVIDLVSGARTRLTSDPNWEQSPVWSPKGDRIAYRLGPAIYVQEIDGGKPQRISEFGSGAAGFVHDWSADGKYLLLTQSSIAGGGLARLSLSDGRIEAIAPSSATEGGDARLSTDGRWVAYRSRETGSIEVHIRSFPDGRATHRVTTTGGDTPLWSRDGKELFYRDSDGWVVACPLRLNGSSVETGSPVRLFRPTIANTWGTGYQHDVDLNGRFFIYRVGDDTASFANTLTVMLNWTKSITRAPR